MKIVDSQVHIWAPPTPERPWPARHQPHREQALGAEALITEMDQSGVDAAVLVPPSWEGEYNDLISRAVAEHPSRFAAMAVAPPADVPALIANWRFPKGVVGLRCPLHRPGLVEALNDGRMDRVFEAAQAHDIPLMVLVPYDLLPKLNQVARDHPTLKLIVDHLGLIHAPGDLRKELRQVLALAERTNVALKATCLPWFSTQPYPYPDVQLLVKDAITAFGTKRVFWGTDMTRLPCSYSESVRMVTEEMPFLSSTDREWFMGRGLCEWLDIESLLERP